MARHNCTGQLKFNAMDSKLPWLREGSTKGGSKYQTLNLSISSAKNNRANMELFGMVQDEIKTMDADGNKIDISWEDRNDENVIKSVASYKKNVIDVGEGRKEFIAPWDFIEYVKEHIDELKEGNYTVTGQVNKDFYNGNCRDRFQIQNIYKADEDTKCQLRVTLDFYWTAEDVDTADWKSEKKITINGYTTAYISDEKKNMYVPQTIVFDASKIDFDNEKHVKLTSYKLKQIGLALDGEKIKNNLKAKKVYKLPIVCNYINGSQVVEMDESMLNDNQREAIELGIKKLEDFIQGNVYGDRITEYKLIDFDLRGDYENGCVALDESVTEFNEEIYTPPKEESVDDLEKKESKSEEKVEEDDDEDLFA